MDGVKLPALTPGPLNVPPVGLPVNVTADASIQYGPYVPASTTGNGLTTMSVVALFVHPLASV